MFSLGFWTPVMVFAGLNATVALGVYISLLSGAASVGHAAFAGLGAYAAAVLTTNFGVPFPVAVLAGVLVGLVIGALLSLITIRMNELVVALTTLGFGETMVVIAYNVDYIGGANSFSGVAPYTNIGLVYVVLALVMYLTWRLDDSRIGLAARAMRDSRTTASAMGINVTWVRVVTFALGTAVAALGGALSAHYTLVVNPGDMEFYRSFYYKIIVLFGGSYTFIGPVVGAMILTLLPEVLREAFALSEALSLSLRYMVYGLIIVVVVIRRPQGIITRVPTGVRAGLFRRKPSVAPAAQPIGATATQAPTVPATQAEGPTDNWRPG